MIWQQWFIIIWLLANVASASYRGIKKQDFSVTIGGWIWLTILTNILYTGGFWIIH